MLEDSLANGTEYIQLNKTIISASRLRRLNEKCPEIKQLKDTNASGHDAQNVEENRRSLPGCIKSKD